MITRIQGVLEAIQGQTAILDMPGSGLAYAVSLTSYTAARLGADPRSLGQTLRLHAFSYIEAPSQGASYYPRLAGFTTPEDRDFFETLTEVKGIGYRKALRAMALETSTIAGAIADRDAKLLQSLPEIGKRTAETVIATLHDKVARFLSVAPAPRPGGGPQAPGSPELGAKGRLTRDALEILLSLGETRVDALALIDKALSAAKDAPADAASLVALAYQYRK